MATLSIPYTLAGSSTVIFNNGTLGTGSLDDLFWIQAIHGLDGPALRTPMDDVPYGDGGLIHKFWKGPRHVSFEGVLIVQSIPFGSNGCEAVLDELEADLNECLDSMIQSAGTLSWTSGVYGAQTLSVYYEIPLDIQPVENYMLRSFTFGLVSPAADPT